MKDHEMKIEKHLASHEVAALLRAIADALEHGDHAALARLGMDTHEANKLKIDLRQEGIHLDLRLKIKDVHKGGTPGVAQGTVKPAKEEGLRPAYADLKKRMKSDFAALLATLKGETMPTSAAVEAFLADAELMVTYPGHGDAHYDAFRRDCQALRKASNDNDVKAWRDALAAISERKRECHKLHKR